MSDRYPVSETAHFQKGKRGLLHLVFSRMGVILLLVLLQVALLLALYLKFAQYVAHYYGISALLTMIMAIYLVNRHAEPTYTITWLVFLLAAPLPACAFYGYTRLEIGHRALRSRLAEITRLSAHMLSPTGAEQALCREAPEEAGLVHYLSTAGGFPVYDRTRATYYPTGEAFFQALLEDLEQAKRSIFLEYFILEEGVMWGKILDVLTRKVDEGVDVRFLYDGTCEFFRVSRDYCHHLEDLGLQCRVFAPIRPFLSTHYNYRDHRKIAVIDSRIAYTGGVNLADEYINVTHPFGHWKDTAIRLEGDAARTFTLLFLQMWQMDGRAFSAGPWLDMPAALPQGNHGYVIPYGDHPLDGEPVGEWVYTHILNQARRYVHIMSPYLILDSELEDALRFAAKRGVEVTLLLPHVPDKKVPFALAKTHFLPLMDAGVKIYEYTPGFVHAKVFVSDDLRGTVGTINLDYRSLYHHFECGTYLYGAPCVAALEEDFQQTLAQSRQITRHEAAHPGLYWRFLGMLSKVLAPLM